MTIFPQYNGQWGILPLQRGRVPDSRSSYRPRCPDFGKDDQDLSVFYNETTRLVVLHPRRTPKVWRWIWDPVISGILKSIQPKRNAASGVGTKHNISRHKTLWGRAIFKVFNIFSRPTAHGSCNHLTRKDHLCSWYLYQILSEIPKIRGTETFWVFKGDFVFLSFNPNVEVKMSYKCEWHTLIQQNHYRYKYGINLQRIPQKWSHFKFVWGEIWRYIKKFNFLSLMQIFIIT